MIKDFMDNLSQADTQPLQSLENPTSPPSPNFPFLAILLSSLTTTIVIVGSYFGYQYFKPIFNTNLTGPSCTKEAKVCPDGTTVGRTGPNCEFDPCPDLDTTSIPSEWKTYSNTEISFSYPPNLVSQGQVNGPASQTGTIVTSLNEPLVNTGSGHLFNGFTVYVAELKNQTFDQFVNAERDAIIQQSLSLADQTTNTYLDTTTQGSCEWKHLTTDTFFPDTHRYYLQIPQTNTVIVIGKVSTNSTWDQVFDQILSTFKFISPTATPTPSFAPPSTRTLNYQLPTGWQVAQDLSHSFEIGFDPTTDTASTHLERGLMLLSKSGTQSVHSNFDIVDYDGGSRHKFMAKMMGESLNESDKLPGFKEAEYTIQGKKCLIYDGYQISMSGAVWGMCPITPTKALFFNLKRENYEQRLKTIKFL